MAVVWQELWEALAPFSASSRQRLAVPDAPVTRITCASGTGVNRIVSSRLQVPPAPYAANASGRGAPPSISIRYSRSLVKKPISRLFGDQKG